MVDDQRDAIAFLSDPSSYGSGIGSVEHHATHISHVFLAGERAYKLKRAVKYPYLDFSTVELRHDFCEAELALNRRTAPELYLEVRPIVRGVDGKPAWGAGPAGVRINANDTIIDWVVVMRRFDQDLLLSAIAKADVPDRALLFALAAAIASFHEAAPQRVENGRFEAIEETIGENDTCLRACGEAGFPDEKIGWLRDRSSEWLRRVGPLLDRRRLEGKVRRCHGDLHTRNICILDGKPVLFDCLEFSDELASIDVLYDLAFLLMDLAHLGRAEAANLVFNRYLDLTGDDGGLPALPLFIALRAAIRAHVTGSALQQASPDSAGPAEALAYLDEACAVLEPAPPRLVAIGGLSGTGKSTLAAALAPELGARPGARILRSDVIRKRLFGLAPEARLPEAGYSTGTTERVYAALRDGAARALRAGFSAIIDAVALREDERQAFAQVARELNVPFLGLWLEAPTETIAARVDTRRNDASDATREVVEQQSRFDPGKLDWRRIDAGAGATAVLATARRLLRRPVDRRGG
ncbi:MAG TPA: AAA family ATPase [Stellaceae bacterium]|nr:AAA family ATPase [Stellaceae bacterium]